MVGDVCGGKKSDLKTVALRNVIGCVVRHYWLGWGLLWLFHWLVRHPWRRIDRIPLYQDEINEAFFTLILVLWTRIVCLWTEKPFRARPVLSMSTLSAKGIGCMDWPDPPLMLIQQSMYGKYSKNIHILG